MPNDYAGLGTNMPYRRGKLFIKPAVSGGSPHAEEAMGHLSDIVGLPHTHPRYYEIEDKPHTVAKYLDNMVPLQHLTTRMVPEVAASVRRNPDRVGNIALLEWLGGIRDRTAANHTYHPEHGLMSIDHGVAAHPLTDYWPHIQSGAISSEKLSSPAYGSLVKNPIMWSEAGSLPSALSMFLRHAGIGEAQQHRFMIPPHTVDRVLRQHKDVLDHIDHATTGLPDIERRLARRAAELRLTELARQHATGPMFVQHLADLAHRVRQAAQHES